MHTESAASLGLPVPDAVRSPLPQRPYQAEAIEAVHDAWEANRATLLVMATGTGKTYTFCRMLVRRRDQGYGRALVLAHRIELIDQAIAACERAGLTAEAECGDRLARPHGDLVTPPADVVVATVQTLRGRRLDRWPETAFGTVVIDECHHATAQSYRSVLDRFPLARVLGVTATPDRGDGVGLGGVFEHVAYRYEMIDAIREGYLCPIRVTALDSPELDVGTIRVTRQEHGRDLNAGDIAQQLDTSESLLALATQIVEKVGDRPTVVFTPSVMMAHRLADTLAHVSHRRASAIDGMSALDDRARILAEYAAGEIQFVTNCAVLTEGWDAPQTAAVVILRPTKSRALYAQMIGRGTRIAPGKVDCLVCDLTCNSDDHTLISPLDCLGGKPLSDAVRKLAQSAVADGDDVTAAVEKAEKIANEREEARRKRRDERAKTKVKARVKYGEREINPFREWIARTKSDVHPMNPLARKIERLLAAGVDVPANVTPEQCDAWSAMIAQRAAAGLCTLKQAKVLRKRGLRWRDVSREEAGAVITALAAAGWRSVPRDIAERYRA